MHKPFTTMKYLTLLILIILFSNPLQAQVYQESIKTEKAKVPQEDFDNFHFRFKAGYGLAAGGKTFNDLGFNLSSANISAGTNTYSNKKFSLGGGFQMEGALTYWLSPNFGLDLGLNYTQGAAATATINYYEALIDHTDNINFYGNMFSIVPSIVVAGKLGKLNPYMRCGFVLGFSKPIDQETVSAYNTSSNERSTYVAQLQLSGAAAYGFKATIGNAIPINESTDFIQEIGFNFISYTPTKGEIISFEQNGQQMVDQLYNSDRYYIYKKSITGSNNQQTNMDEPSVGLASTYPYNNISIMVGIRFKF